MECVCDWFRKKYKFVPTVRPQYEEYVHDRSANLDFEVQASGSISKDEARALQEVCWRQLDYVGAHDSSPVL